MAREERADEAVVLLANDALSVELFPHFLAGPYLAASAVMGQQLLGIVAPSNAVGTAKSWAGGAATYVSQELLCFCAGSVMRTLFSCFSAVLMSGGYVGEGRMRRVRTIKFVVANENRSKR